MRKFLLAAVAALGLFASASTASANIVSNGDFSAGGADWSLSGNTGYSGFPGYWSDGAVGSDAYLSQVIPTIAGHTYSIAFDANVNWGTMAGYLNGNLFANTGYTGGWAHFVATVIADISNATLTFVTRNDPSWNYLDNVVVEDLGGGNNVPEPLTLSLLGAGLVGLAAARRRKTA